GRGSIAKRTAEQAKQRGGHERDNHERDEHLEQRESIGFGSAHGGERSALLENRDATSEPIDVHFVFALAGRDGNATAIAPAVWKEANGADLFIDDVVLRGEQLQGDAGRQRIFARLAIDLEPTPFDVDGQKRFALLRQCFATRGAQARRELARGRSELARRHAVTERGQHHSRNEREDGQYNEELQQRHAGLASRFRIGKHATGHAVATIGPLPVRDVFVRAFTAFLAIGAVRDQIVWSVLAGSGVLVFVSPRILRDLGLLPI